MPYCVRLEFYILLAMETIDVGDSGMYGGNLLIHLKHLEIIIKQLFKEYFKFMGFTFMR